MKNFHQRYQEYLDRKRKLNEEPVPTNIMNTGDDIESEEDSVNNDPQFPDMPEEQDEEDFEIWKLKYVKDSIKGDPNKLIQKILEVRDRELEPINRKFIEDNLDINFLRQNANILQTSTDIRRLIKTDFDRTNPGAVLARHIANGLEKNPMLNEVYLKLLGMGGAKGDLHRKFVAALTGSVQVGSGGQNEDLIYEELDYSIRISTRFNYRWGDVNLGQWYLKENDPEKFLRKIEMNRLESGSPEEKDVLRRRILIESIASNYLNRSFIINVTAQDGTISHLGWDLGNSLKTAYLDGKLVLRTKSNDNKSAFIDEEGSIITVPNLNIYYVKETSELDGSDMNDIEEIEFIQYRDGVLYLTAQLDLIKEAAMSLQGMSYQESIWNGSPADIRTIMRCVPSASEILLRKC